MPERPKVETAEGPAASPRGASIRPSLDFSRLSSLSKTPPTVESIRFALWTIPRNRPRGNSRLLNKAPRVRQISDTNTRSASRPHSSVRSSPMPFSASSFCKRALILPNIRVFPTPYPPVMKLRFLARSVERAIRYPPASSMIALIFNPAPLSSPTHDGLARCCILLRSYLTTANPCSANLAQGGPCRRPPHETPASKRPTANLQKPSGGVAPRSLNLPVFHVPPGPFPHSEFRILEGVLPLSGWTGVASGPQYPSLRYRDPGRRLDHALVSCPKRRHRT